MVTLVATKAMNEFPRTRVAGGEVTWRGVWRDERETCVTELR